MFNKLVILNYMKKLLLPLAIFATALVGCTTSNEPQNGTTSGENSEQVYKWSKEVDPLLRESLGEYFDYLPVIENATFEAQNSYNKEYDITFTSLYAYGDFSSSDAKFYAIGLELDGFTRTYDESTGYHSCYLQMSYTTAMAVQVTFSIPHKCIVLSAYKQTLLYDEFPEEKVKDYVGENIPDPALPYYSWRTLTVQSIEYFAIYCYPDQGKTFSSQVVSDYCAKLEAAGYTIDDSYAIYGNYYAQNKSNTYSIYCIRIIYGVTSGF